MKNIRTIIFVLSFVLLTQSVKLRKRPFSTVENPNAKPVVRLNKASTKTKDFGPPQFVDPDPDYHEISPEVKHNFAYNSKEEFPAEPWAREKQCHDAAAPKVAFRFNKKTSANINKYSSELQAKLNAYTKEHDQMVEKRKRQQEELSVSNLQSEDAILAKAKITAQQEVDAIKNRFHQKLQLKKQQLRLAQDKKASVKSLSKKVQAEKKRFHKVSKKATKAKIAPTVRFAETEEEAKAETEDSDEYSTITKGKGKHKTTSVAAASTEVKAETATESEDTSKLQFAFNLEANEERSHYGEDLVQTLERQEEKDIDDPAEEDEEIAKFDNKNYFNPISLPSSDLSLTGHW